MKKYIIILAFLMTILSVFLLSNNNNNFLEDVEHATVLKTSESGIKERDLSPQELKKFRDLINSFDFKKIENDDAKGWTFNLVCYGDSVTPLYSASLLNNTFVIDSKSYEINKREAEELIKYVDTLFE